MGHDAIELLTHDHREVEELFSKYEQATDDTQRKDIADQAIIELIRHSVAEEEYLYPATRDAVSDGDSLVDKELTEHAEAEKTMNRLDGLSADDPQFDSTMRELMAEIEQHVAGEEGTLFPKLRQTLSNDELVALGEKLQTAKKMAPTRPHPAAPDHPPFNKMAAPGAALVDRIRDWLTGRGQKS